MHVKGNGGADLLHVLRLGPVPLKINIEGVTLNNRGECWPVESLMLEVQAGMFFFLFGVLHFPPENDHRIVMCISFILMNCQVNQHYTIQCPISIASKLK